jgi:hypothetical protein
MLAGPYTTTKLVWGSFIPYARIDAPPIGCDYGSGYEFDGNNRGYGTYFGDWPSKTKINADVSLTSADNEGAFTITVTRTGNYGILSGEHRQMPNHEVIIMSTTSNATSVTYTEAVVYRRDLSSPLCLVSMVCEKASMAGYTGTY